MNRAQQSAPSPGRRSWRLEPLAVTMKLASALCGLAAAVLFVRPLVQGEVVPGPRYITLRPTTVDEPPEPAKPPTPSKPTETPPPSTISPPPPETGTKEVQEQRSAFKGALLMLESQPSRATVRVNGTNQGETPVTVGLDCTPGSTLVISFSLKGFENTTHRTPCPKDALVTVTARLRKGTGKAPGKR